MSPSSSCGPYSRIACGTCSTIDPRCTGCAKPCATERSSASKNAHEKSERVLMFVEYALRFSARTISSVAATRALRITSNEMGSTLIGLSFRDMSRCQTPATELQQIAPGAASARWYGQALERNGRGPVSDTCNRTVTGSRAKHRRRRLVDPPAVDRDAVHLARAPGRDLPLEHVPQHAPRVTLAGRPVAAAAAGPIRDRVAGLDLDRGLGA